MPEKIDTIMFAPCGINCQICYKHCQQDMLCSGCLRGDQPGSEHGRKCKIKDCVAKKSLTYCFECPDYPCKMIGLHEKGYQARYHMSLLENGRFVQTHGAESFMEQQREKYTCPKCGGVISNQSMICSDCGEEQTADSGS